MADQFKLFIGGLASETTTQSLHDHFAAYGAITDCIVMVDQMGKSRGFGFVTYDGQEAYDYVLNSGGQVIVDGKTVEAKAVDGKKGLVGGRGMGGDRHQSSGAGLRTGKIFIGGISTIPTDVLRQYFEQFGEVTDAIAMVDGGGKPRGFGFATFADPSVVRQVSNMSHNIDGQQVDVKPADGGNQGGRQQNQAPHSHQGPYQSYGQQGHSQRPQSYGGSGGGHRGTTESNKIFVGGLPSSVTDNRLHDLFQMYGQIVDCVAFANRGFGYVTFANYRGMKTALDVGSVNIDGKMVQIKACDVPRDAPRGAPPQRPMGGQRGYGPGPSHHSAPPARRGGGVGSSVGKVFVGGLSQHTTNESFRAYWESFGELTDHIVMTDSNRRSRGFGFVTFADPLLAEQVIAQANEIDGQPVDCKLADGNRDGGPQRGPSHSGAQYGDEGIEPCKVFIGGLPESMTTNALQQHMSQFGEIVDAIAMSGRGFGYVTYATPDAAEAALSNQRLNLDGKMVEVKACTVPRRKMPSQQRPMNMRSRPY